MGKNALVGGGIPGHEDDWIQWGLQMSPDFLDTSAVPDVDVGLTPVGRAIGGFVLGEFDPGQFALGLTVAPDLGAMTMWTIDLGRPE